MNEKQDSLIIDMANHIYSTHDTIRNTAKIYGYSKSTVHNYISSKLKKINFALYKSVKKVLDENFAEKHIRGGEATKIKYFHIKNKKGTI